MVSVVGDNVVGDSITPLFQRTSPCQQGWPRCMAMGTTEGSPTSRWEWGSEDTWVPLT